LQNQAKTERLQKDIAAFIGQEAMHAKEHEHLNQLIQSSGLNTEPVSANVEWLMARLKKYFTPTQQLAITSAAEHFTAIIARQIMRRSDLQERLSSNETLKNIWLWHAVEESEHKSVAFDLYQDVSGGNFIRLLVMPFVTLYMAGIMAAGTVYLGITHFSAWKLLHLKEFNALILGRNGFLSTLWKDYLDYYKLDFHPEQHDSKALEERTKAQLGF
ncbi:metal-dependent hydrolase, partial [Acinetobacter baumannii]